MNKLKWQIHSETSITQIMLWWILGLLIGGWFWIIAGIMMFGNFVTLVKSSTKLGTDYFKKDSNL